MKNALRTLLSFGLACFLLNPARADVAPPQGTHNLEVGIRILNTDEYPDFEFAWTHRSRFDSTRIDRSEDWGEREIMNGETEYPIREYLVARRRADTAMTWTYWSERMGERLFGIADWIRQIEESYRIDSLSNSTVHLSLVSTEYLDQDGNPVEYAGEDEARARRLKHIGIGAGSGLLLLMAFLLIRRRRARHG